MLLHATRRRARRTRATMTRETRRGYQRAQVLITVKTYPNPSSKYDETVCVAGVRLDRGAPEWIRLYPVRFRNVDEGVQFDKYEIVEVDVTPHGTTDSRIESVPARSRNHRAHSRGRLQRGLDRNTRPDWRVARSHDDLRPHRRSHREPD